MMTKEELIEKCYGVRNKAVTVDEDLVSAIEADVTEYRTHRTEPIPQLPPPVLAELLPHMGWLIYETSLRRVQEIDAAFEALPEERRATNQESYDLVVRLSDAGRKLPWPEFAPRGLGAIRAQALAASKRDTPLGYDAAWLLHDEAREKYLIFKESHGAAEERNPYLLALEETRIQLALAETGTACRTAELTIGRWSEEVAKGTWSDDDGDEWVQRMFRELARGVETGQEAMGVVTYVEEAYGLVTTVDEHRLALRTAHQNPSIMTARAALLMYSLTPEMERLDRLPPWDHEKWEEARTDLLERFEEAYRKIEEPAKDDEGAPMPLSVSHLRSLIQLRLHLALIAPGTRLPTTLDPAVEPPACLGRAVLDDEAVEAMSEWLAEVEGGKQHGDANVIGSATMPVFIRSVEECRKLDGVATGYREWRRRWFNLDRHANEDGRRGRVKKVLETA